MKKSLFTIALGVLCSTAFAQRSVVLDAFTKYHIDTNILNPAIKQRPENLSFDYNYTSVSSGQRKVTVAKFDATKTGDDRWVVISVNGNSPSSLEVSSFKKEHSKQAAAGSKIDDNSMKVEKENAEQLVVSYKIDATNLPKEASFLKDCRNYLTINLHTKRLEQLQTLNEKPVKIKIINAEKLDLVIKYTYNEQEQKYLPDSEDLNLVVKFLGQEAPLETISEYSNYSRK